jgi:phosphocarrier protein
VTTLSRSARIVNLQGLHARPCHMIVSIALEHRATLRVRCGRNEANGKSILELMTLNAPEGSELLLEAAGEDAAALIERVVAVIDAGFGEPMR